MISNQIIVTNGTTPRTYDRIGDLNGASLFKDKSAELDVQSELLVRNTMQDARKPGARNRHVLQIKDYEEQADGSYASVSVHITIDRDIRFSKAGVIRVKDYLCDFVSSDVLIEDVLAGSR